MIRRPPRSPLFPYPTLFRSLAVLGGAAAPLSFFSLPETPSPKLPYDLPVSRRDRWGWDHERVLGRVAQGDHSRGDAVRRRPRPLFLGALRRRAGAAARGRAVADRAEGSGRLAGAEEAERAEARQGHRYRFGPRPSRRPARHGGGSVALSWPAGTPAVGVDRQHERVCDGGAREGSVARSDGGEDVPPVRPRAGTDRDGFVA